MSIQPDPSPNCDERPAGIVIDTIVLHATVLDAIFNEWMLRKFRDNLRRMDRATSLDLMLGDIEVLVKRSQPTERSACLVVA